VGALIGRLGDERVSVRVRAGEALGKITGAELGEDPEGWRVWERSRQGDRCDR